MAVVIGVACADEVEAILDMQRRAFASEAVVYGCEIAPVCERPESLLRDMGEAVVLVARSEEGQVVGHVRGHQLDDGSALVRRLCVDPEWQKRGVGSQLMEEIEQRVRPRTHYWLFTGAKSPQSIAFYARRGYVEVSRKVMNEQVTFVNMRKWATN